MIEIEHKKTKQIVIIILTFIVLLIVITSLFLFQSKNFKATPTMENNRSGNSNGSIVKSQNTTNATKNIISIPMEKPPFIKD